MMEERRKYVRIPKRAQISYSIIPSAKQEQYVTSDISQGGIRFLVHQFIPKASHLKIKLDLDEVHMTIEALVRLAWIKQMPNSSAYEVGVQFIDIPAKAVEHLVEYIKFFASNKSDKDCHSI